MPRSKTTMYGTAELAEELGVDRYRVSMWLNRGNRDIPEPDARLSMGPVWLAATVRGWLRATKRQLAREAAS